MRHPLRLVAFGLLLMATAWLVLFLAALRSIPPVLSLLLLAYGSSLAGLLLSLAGLAVYMRTRRHP